MNNNAIRKRHNSYSVAEKVQLVEEFFAKNVNRKNAKKFASSKNISEQTIYDWIRNYKKKAYEKVANTSERKRVKEFVYKPVEDYIDIDLRQQLYKRDKCGLSRLILKEKAASAAKRLLNEELQTKFRASDGFLTNINHKRGLTKVRFRCRAADVDDEEAMKQTAEFRNNLEALLQ